MKWGAVNIRLLTLMRRGSVLAAVLSSAAAASSASAQAWDHKNAVDELDKTVLSLGGVEALGDEDIAELSRLLASPLDQVRWLLKAAEVRAAKDAEAARKALPLAEQRLAEWQSRCARSDGEFASWCRHREAAFADLSRQIEALRSRLPQTKLASMVKPAEIAARLKVIATKGGTPAADTTPIERYQLWARGVPLSMEMPTTPRAAANVAAWEGWQVPAAILSMVAGGARPATLVGWERPLAISRSQPDAWKNADKSSAEERSAILQLHRVAAALLGSVVGVDGDDRGEPDANVAATWQQLADEAAGQNLWRLEFAARWLQCLTSDADAAKAVAAAAVGRYDATLAIVSPEAKQNRELRAALDGLRSGKASALPSAFAYREAARANRRQLSTEFVQLHGANPKAHDEAYALMQRIKAADAGLPPPTPVTLADLKKRFANSSDPNVPSVHLLLEVLEAGGQYYGLAVGSQNYTLLPGDAWRTEWFAAGSPAELLAQALWNRDADKSAISIIVAPDGAMRAAAWHSGGESALRARIDPTFFGASSDNTSSWLVYVPTTAALTTGNKAWTLDQAVRFWRLGQSGAPGESSMTVRIGGSAKLPEYPCRPCSTVYVFDFGGGAEQAGRFLSVMQELKKGSPIAAVGLP